MKDIFDFAVLAGLYAFVFYKKWKAKGRDVLIVNTAMYVYLAFVLYFTLMPVIMSLPSMFDHPYTPMNLEPFIDVTLGRGDFVRQIVLNVVMTVPFGFLFPLVERSRARLLEGEAGVIKADAGMTNGRVGLVKTVGCTFLLSLAIELVQPLMSGGRSSDITDIITNVIGGVIGYGVYLILRPVTEKLLGLLRGERAK